MNLRRWTALATPLAISLSLLSACGGSGGGSSNVRLINATSEYSAFDLFQSTTQLTTGVASFTAGSYASLGDGTYTFNVKASGSGTTSVTSSRTIAKDTYNTLIAYVTGGNLLTALLTDAEVAPDSGSAKFRLFNTASIEAGAVDVYLITTACSTLASTTSPATATNVSSFSSYVQVTAPAAGTSYHVCVTAQGSKSDLRLDIPAVTLKDQEITTLVLTHTTGGVLLQGLLVDQQGPATKALNTSARVRVAAAAAQNAQVSAVVNGVTLSSGLASPAISGSYQLVPAGALTSTVLIGTTAVPTSGLTAIAGADLTLLVAGTAAAPTVALINDDNTPSTNTSNPVKIRLVNVLNGAPGPVTLTDNFSVVADGVAFGAVSIPALVPANLATSGALVPLVVTFSGTTLATIPNATLTGGAVYTLFLTGDYPAPANATSPIANIVPVLRKDR